MVPGLIIGGRQKNPAGVVIGASLQIFFQQGNRGGILGGEILAVQPETGLLVPPLPAALPFPFLDFIHQFPAAGIVLPDLGMVQQLPQDRDILGELARERLQHRQGLIVLSLGAVPIGQQQPQLPLGLGGCDSLPGLLNDLLPVSRSALAQQIRRQYLDRGQGLRMFLQDGP
ncbi:MAG: hypothetical protein BWY71_02141 [Planctomycetes bacterium ADurb.Bin412]|nr:MAG: hypothetical protein BWY71_02141 [Planctomycetes bacterium ADurb.Bin412]